MSIEGCRKLIEICRTYVEGVTPFAKSRHFMDCGSKNFKMIADEMAELIVAELLDDYRNVNTTTIDLLKNTVKSILVDMTGKKNGAKYKYGDNWEKVLNKQQTVNHISVYHSDDYYRLLEIWKIPVEVFKKEFIDKWYPEVKEYHSKPRERDKFKHIYYDSLKQFGELLVRIENGTPQDTSDFVSTLLN